MRVSVSTEPVLGLMVEAVDERLTTRAAQALAGLIADEFGYGELEPAED